MDLIDTHLHLVDRSRLDYPWLSGEPALNRDWSYETYAQEARRCGITDVLHMEVDVAPGHIEAETAQVRALVARPGSLIRGAISACRPESAEFPAFLERQLADATVRGFRRILHTQPDALSQTRLFHDNVARLSGTDKPFDLCVLPHQIPIAAALIDACPDVQFVLDHCGVPAVKDRNEHPWRENIVEVARRPNVVVKISGIVAYADPAGWSIGDLRPYVEHVVGAFGWDRVVWGSDWPVVTLGGALSTWVAATHALMADASSDERAGLFHRNARRVWGLSPRSKVTAS